MNLKLKQRKLFFDLIELFNKKEMKLIEEYAEAYSDWTLSLKKK